MFRELASSLPPVNNDALVAPRDKNDDAYRFTQHIFCLIIFIYLLLSYILLREFFYNMIDYNCSRMVTETVLSAKQREQKDIRAGGCACWLCLIVIASFYYYCIGIS